MVNRIYKKVIIAVLAISLSLSGIVSAGAAEKKEQFAVIPAQENVKLLVNNKKQYLTINQAGDVAYNIRLNDNDITDEQVKEDGEELRGILDDFDFDDNHNKNI